MPSLTDFAFGLTIGVCLTCLILLFTRDFIISHFLKNSVLKAIPLDGKEIQIPLGNIQGVDTKFLNDKISMYIDLLFGIREAIVTLIETFKETEAPEESYLKLTILLGNVDKELDALAEGGFVKKTK